jgi:M6 family metalloprotease-like protein
LKSVKAVVVACLVLALGAFAVTPLQAHRVSPLKSRFWTLPFPPSDLQNDRLVTGVLELRNTSGKKISARCVVVAHDASHEVIGRQRLNGDVKPNSKTTIDLRMEYEAAGWRYVDHLHVTHCHSSGTPPLPSVTTSPPDSQLGLHAYLTILCRFADKPQEPHPPEWFEELMGDAEPGARHYFNEISYGQFDVGAGDVSGWHELSKSYDYYMSGGRLPEAQAECIRKADVNTDFGQYEGVMLMFNGELGASAGRAYFKVDGKWRFLSLARAGSATDDPALGSFEDQAIVMHELIHAVGVHFHSAVGSSVNNGWDAMSDPGNDCAGGSGIHGCVAQHPIAFFKHVAGWIPEANTYIAQQGTQSVTLHPLAGPIPSSGYLWAKVPVGGSEKVFITVELRRKQGYDEVLPGEGVIIHVVDLTPVKFGLLPTIAAKIVDADGDGDADDDGAVFTVAETYEHPSGITITVVSENPDGSVTVEIQSP